jgi:hypothetical protein
MKTRQEMIVALRSLYGSGIEVEHVIDYLQDVWETYDLLARLFGSEYAYKAITAPPCIRSHQVNINDVDESILN